MPTVCCTEKPLDYTNPKALNTKDTKVTEEDTTEIKLLVGIPMW